MTNADKIRNMSDEELARLIGDNIMCVKCSAFEGMRCVACPPFDVGTCGDALQVCHDIWLKWLKAEGSDTDG